MDLNNLRATAVPIRWHPGLPIYASEPFLQSLGDEYGWIGGTDDSGKLRCVLPYTIVRKPGFRMIQFRVETIPLDGELELDEERGFLGSVVDHFRSAGADLILPSGNTAIFRTYPEGAAAAPYGTFVKDLTLPEEGLLGEIRKTFRQNIRKAANAGVQVKCDQGYLDAAYEMIAATMKRSGSSFRNYPEFKSRVSAFGEQVKVFVAEHDGAMQGCMVAPFSMHTAYNCYAGSRPQPVLGAMHLLHWEAIRQFRAMGVQRFDFQGVRINPEKGSKQEGILSYKRGFGGRFVQGYLWKCSLRPLKSAAYSVAVRLLKGGDIVDQEHCKLAGA
jgi:Acetyltransferase (GNAT) domain